MIASNTYELAMKCPGCVTGVLGCLNVNRAAKTKKRAGWQNLSKDINKFLKKGPQIRCIPHGRWGLAQCKLTWEEHAGSDKSFENITLCLDQLPLKIQFTKEKKTLKTVGLSRKANTLPQCKSSCKKQAGSDKNLSVNPIPWSAAALNAIYKANQSTNCPFKLEMVLKLAHLIHPISDHELQTEDVTIQMWGLTYTQIWWELCPTFRVVIILPPRQPRFLARLPRWKKF